jgi:hypothetical protein
MKNATLGSASVAAPLEFLTLGDKQYRVGKLTPEQLHTCQKLGAAIGKSELQGVELNRAVAEIILNLLAEHHPDFTVADLPTSLSVLPALGTEVARQLMQSSGAVIH